MTKQCCACGQIKPATEFYRATRRKDGLQTKCKPCSREQSLAWAKKNPERAERIRLRYVSKVRGEVRKKALAYYYANVEKRREAARARYRSRDKAEINRYVQEYRRRPERNVHKRISGQLWYVLKSKKGGRSWPSLLGYSSGDLLKHIERQFTKGMSWKNIGEWHIDHIVPLSAFQITGPDCPEVRAAWALTNLRPMWAPDNRRKSDKRTHLL